jgi:hypothetical protein
VSVCVWMCVRLCLCVRDEPGAILSFDMSAFPKMVPQTCCGGTLKEQILQDVSGPMFSRLSAGTSREHGSPQLCSEAHVGEPAFKGLFGMLSERLDFQIWWKHDFSVECWSMCAAITEAVIVTFLLKYRGPHESRRCLNRFSRGLWK